MTRRALAALLSAALLLPGCRQGPVVVPPRTLRIALGTLPISFDPHATNEVVAFSVNAQLYETLVTTDRDLHPRPGLASSWYNPDDRTWTFELEPGLRFQDGSALTSADVAFSLLRARSDPLSEWGPGLLSLESVETPAPERVVVRTSAPDATLLQALAQTAVVPRWAGPIAGSRLRLRPVGSGPYRMLAWDPTAGRLELAAWDGFHGDPPAIPRVSFSFIRDDRERVAALVSGRQDLIGDVPPELAVRIASARGARLVELAGLIQVFLGFDVARQRTPYASPPRNPFRDLRVRRAFLAAIDRTRLVREALGDAGDPARQLVAPSVFGFDPELSVPGPDPGLARRLLAEAGYPGGFSVVLDAPATSYVGDVRVAPFLARSLEQVGVRVSPRLLPKHELFRRETGRDTSLYIGGWNCVSGDMQEVLDFLLHTPDPARGYGSENAGGYSNPDLDRLAERARQTMRRHDRLGLLRRAARLAVDDVPWVPLYVARERYGLSADLRWSPRPDKLILAAEMAFARRPAAPPRR